ncbi:CGNR zinc finger domain-containing protein [Actinokineospora sp. UTMC 2448]|uniref:CGNR zinc finger domain-containing protein n=1 Tax=Actinokineospora sp. UTMC 2448 TaxID=2268449 RepID=UPI002164C9E0|nr:CGNR zinc finger domain-containing protein [Actinokineospora sp. UTMC 2448]
MDFDSHSSVVLDAALGLINEVTPGHRRGRPYRPPTGSALVTAITDVIRQRDRTWSAPPSPEAAESLAAYGVRMHAVIAAVAEDIDTACEEVNRIMRETDATPVLARHDNEPWHLHFHAPDAPWDISWAASMATGLAVVLGNATVERLGICTAPACDRAYLDVSRNGTRRFCSTACQNRVKTAAFRARKGAGG